MQKKDDALPNESESSTTETTPGEPKIWTPGGANVTDSDTYRKNANRLSPLRWAPGQDPRDDDAYPGSGYEYVKLVVDEDLAPTPASKRFEGYLGVDSHMTCWNCLQRTYLIMDERTSQQVGEAQDEVVWAWANNRPVDPVRVPDVLLLYCPACHNTMQLRKEIVREKAEQQDRIGGRIRGDRYRQ